MKTNPAPAAARPSISKPMAAVARGAHAPAVEPAADRPPVAAASVAMAVTSAVASPCVAVAAALEVAAGRPAAVLAAVAHVTAVGRSVTPWAEQICVAKVMAWAWSAALQAPTRQQAILEMKALLEQMHFGSVPQPA